MRCAPGILWIRLPLPMALDHVNVYALEDDDGWMIVDTGIDTRRGRAIWGELLAGPLADKPVARVLVTHYHPDHIGLAGWFQSQGAALITTRTTWLFARMLTLDVQDRPVARTLAFWRQAGMAAALYEKRANEQPSISPIWCRRCLLAIGKSWRARRYVWPGVTGWCGAVMAMLRTCDVVEPD